MPKVKDLMRKGTISIESDKTVLEVAKIMNKLDASGLVVTSKGQPLGIITDRTIIRRFVPRDMPASKIKVSEVMYMPLFTIRPEADLKEATKKIIKHKLTRLVVVEKGKLIGILALSDIARYFAKTTLIDALRGPWSKEESELICPKCRVSTMEAVRDRETYNILMWRCKSSTCGHLE